MKNFTRFVLLISLIAVVAQPMFAQKKRATGLRFDDAAYNAVQRKSDFKGHLFATMPFSASLKQYCPNVGNQGEIGSCVGWASAYAATTILNAIKYGWTDKSTITSYALSALFVYNQIKIGTCDDGSRIPDAAHFLKENGSCLNNSFTSSDCYTLPPDNLFAEAGQYKIKDYSILFTTEETNANERIYKIKQSIADKIPVIIGMTVSEDFMDLKQGTDTWNYNPDNFIYAGGHAMCIIGYDDSRGAFEVMNSWDTNWANNGFVWIKYNDLATLTKYAFQFYLFNKNEDNQIANLEGEFNFRYVVPGNGIVFENATVTHNGNGYYETDRKDWQLGQLFQLVAKNKRDNEYVYVFSIDAQYNANIHFPRKQEYSKTRFHGFNEAPLVPENNVEIIIPTPDSGLSITTLGTDYLCVLFSAREIPDFGAMVQRIRSQMEYGSSMEEALQNNIGEKLVPSYNIQYQADKMSFTCNSNAGSIVPLVLRVDSGQ
ncbi:hypothetical protein C7N43_03665 [Sphingobacteriales bacterium UPWRP_1]|nr:hypothetical protein BVG80_08075 [Sphingobacteriales bacterium TSM_CSM]PSJ78439.1 hypothetical protein C7N43_03665 [Sphingobacteriales bacterium UPWRP_1]